MSVAKKAGYAAAALFLRKCWTSVLSLTVVAYLVSTLGTEAYGILAIASVILSLIQVLAVSGVSEFVIFSRGTSEDQAEAENAAFWFNAFGSLVVVVVGCLVAPLVAIFYDDPRYTTILWIMLAGFFGSMIGSIPKALYRKKIDYGPLVAVETIQLTTVSLGQVVLAWQGFGIYSLVLPSAVVAPIVAWIFIKRSPLRLLNTFGVHRWPSIFSYTKHIIGSRVLTRLANEGDYLVLGAALEKSAVGLYSLAYRMSSILFLSLTPVVADVSLPVFARSSNSPRLLFLRYTKMLSLIMFVMFPLLGILFVVAKPASVAIYGPKESEGMALLVQILIIGVIGRCVSSPTGGLFNATGRPHIPLYFVCVFTPIFLGILLFTSQFGLVPAAITVAASFTVGQLVQTWLVARIVLKVRFRTILGQISRYLVPTLVASAAGLLSFQFVDYEGILAGVPFFQERLEGALAVFHGAVIVLIVYGIVFRLGAAAEIRRLSKLCYSINPTLGRCSRILQWPGTAAAKTNR